MPEMTVRKSIEIYATRQRVWQVITEPEYTRRYMFTCAIASTWQPGDSFNWEAPNGNVMVQGNLVESKPPVRLEYTTFDPNATDYEDVPSNYSTVVYTLEEQGDITVLSVSQGDFSLIKNGEKRYAECEGGWPSVLESIKQVAEE